MYFYICAGIIKAILQITNRGSLVKKVPVSGRDNYKNIPSLFLCGISPVTV